MGKFYKAAMIYKEKRNLAGLKQIIDMFEQARAEGKADNNPDVKEKVNEKLSQMQEQLLREIQIISRDSCDSDIPLWDFSRERKMDVFAENKEVLLRALQEKHKDLYLQVKKENSYTIAGRPEKEQIKYWKEMWDDTKDEKHFVVEIISKNDNEFAGYIAINNTRRPLWEICIELLDSKSGKGYGTHALRLFVDKVAEITGFKEFQVLVEPDNVRSQKMMEHVNAELIGIVDYYFADEEEAEKFEEEHLSEIDDNMISIAAALNVEPRKLISHILEYRIKL